MRFREITGMKITWYGHAAFLMASDDDALRIGLDPYRAPDAGSYAPIDDVADIVALSHENAKYHSHIGAFRSRDAENDFVPAIVSGLALLQNPQPLAMMGASFTAVRVWENDKRNEEIAMVGVAMDGVRVLHMGDCGHAIDAETVMACGNVDVLLALAGEGPTMDLPDLIRFIGDLNPRIVIPMHFGNEKINLNLRPVGDFLALLPPSVPVRTFDTPTVIITRDTLPAQTECWVLPPAR